jgi:hypothetical protein
MHTVLESQHTIAGLAPTASRLLAMKSIDTKLVMHWISGLVSLTRSSRRKMPSSKGSSDKVMAAAGGV